jgi:microcystin-dependent protein
MRRFLLLLGAVGGLLVVSLGAYAQADEPFLGQILIVSFSFAPKGWALCNGQLLPINQNQALFALLGTTFGGDGRQTFALPDLRGRVPIHMGQGPGLQPYTLGERGGQEVVTLTVSQLPAHTHPLLGQSALGTSASPAGAVWAAQSRLNVYSAASPDTQMGAASISTSGGSAPYDNHSPYLTVNYVIALVGVFPSRN